MKLSVVIPAFYPERKDNLSAIVMALQVSTASPDEIIIWNNGPVEAIETVRHLSAVQIIQAPRNFGCKARFLAAMCAQGDYVLFHDDDLMVEECTIENMLDWASSDSIIALNGRKLVKHAPYAAAMVIDGSCLQAPMIIDVSNGRLELVDRDAVQKLLPYVPFTDGAVHDDILFSHAAEQHDMQCAVIPYGENEGFIDLENYGVGSCVGVNMAQHYNERNKLVKELFEYEHQ